MAVRSKRLAGGNVGTASSGTLYTVPIGHRTIIKMISVANNTTDVVGFTLTITKSGGGTIKLVVALPAAGDVNEAKHIPLFQVMHEGDSFAVVGSSTSIDYMVSGAELLL